MRKILLSAIVAFSVTAVMTACGGALNTNTNANITGMMNSSNMMNGNMMNGNIVVNRTNSMGGNSMMNNGNAMLYSNMMNGNRASNTNVNQFTETGNTTSTNRNTSTTGKTISGNRNANTTGNRP